MSDVPVFSIVPIEVWQDRRLTLEQVRVLGALLSFRNKNTDFVWPSRAQISERTGGMHVTNISAATSALEKFGWLVKDGKGGYSKATNYRITVPETVAESATVNAQTTVAQSATVAERATVAESATRPLAESATNPLAESATRKELTKELTNEQTNMGRAAILVDFPDLPEQIAADFIAHRKAKRAPLTRTAWKQIASEIRASGWTATDALSEAMACGWQGVKAEWLANRKNPSRPQSRLSSVGQKSASAANRWLESQGVKEIA